MSLINAMLRDLDSRSADVTALQDDINVRATPALKVLNIKTHFLFFTFFLVAIFIVTQKNLIGFVPNLLDSFSDNSSLISFPSEKPIDFSDNKILVPATIKNKQELIEKSTIVEVEKNGNTGYLKDINTISIFKLQAQQKNDTRLVDGLAIKPKAGNEIELPAQTGDKYVFLEHLLHNAEAAFNENRLTVPKEGSAYALYQQVLEVAPSNKEALIGIERIRSRYQALFNKALDKRHWITAKSYINRAKQVGLAQVGLKEMEAKLADRKNDQHIDGSKPILATAESNFYSQSNEGRQSTERVRFNKIEMAIDTGNLDQAERLLRFETQLSQGRYNYLRAKWLVANNRQQQAIELLEKRPETGSFTFRYYTYLAMLYQQIQQYGAATKIYRTLLVSNHKSIDAWLGLATSLDAQGKYLDALDAYKSAKIIGHRDLSVQRFIQQRIAVLSG